MNGSLVSYLVCDLNMEMSLLTEFTENVLLFDP
jgi:hypothetical protein